MLNPPRIEPGKRADKQLEEWIDHALAEGNDTLAVAAGIASVTQPGGSPDYEVSPELVGNEGWFWPWNRAGFLSLEHQRPADAVTLFTCAYLAALRFQQAGQYRIHKGTPLCNIAYAHLQTNQLNRAVLPALLGMVEDATTSGNPTGTANFQNLLAANYPEMQARSLAGLFLSLTRQRGVTPLYPEAVLDCAQRSNSLFAPDLLNDLAAVAADFRPEHLAPSLEGLARVWGRLSPYLEAVMDRRRTAHGAAAATLPTAGTYAPSGATST